MEEAEFDKEYYKDLLENNLLEHKERWGNHVLISRPCYVGNCTTRRTSYTRAIFSSFLWRAAPSSSLKSGFPTFCTEEKFDGGDWKALCGTTCRRCLANNREITRRFCLFSRVSVTSVHARFSRDACQHRARWNQTPLFMHRASLLSRSEIRVRMSCLSFCIYADHMHLCTITCLSQSSKI